MVLFMLVTRGFKSKIKSEIVETGILHVNNLISHGTKQRSASSHLAAELNELFFSFAIEKSFYIYCEMHFKL